MQRQIALLLRPAHNGLPSCVTAFRKKSSAFANASRHADQPVVVTADLSDFYGSITLADVADLCERLKAGRTVAVILARLCTIDERLMQGGRASPYIANLIGDRVDQAVLSRLSPECRYTRYVDDLAFSGPGDKLPSEQNVADWLVDTGFSLRLGSYFYTKREAGPFVTGLNVATKVPRVSSRFRRRIESFLYFAARYDIESAAKRTFANGKRAQSGEAARRYVQGVVDWLMPMDPVLARTWSAALALV